jgi:hypothetical protein
MSSSVKKNHTLWFVVNILVSIPEFALLLSFSFALISENWYDLDRLIRFGFINFLANLLSDIGFFGYFLVPFYGWLVILFLVLSIFNFWLINTFRLRGMSTFEEDTGG